MAISFPTWIKKVEDGGFYEVQPELTSEPTAPEPLNVTMKEVLVSSYQVSGSAHVGDTFDFKPELTTEPTDPNGALFSFQLDLIAEQTKEDGSMDGLAVDPTDPNTEGDIRVGDFLVERWQHDTIETEAALLI
jgi:hypothetical protein